MASWGLRRFDDDASYSRWQREHVSSEDLHVLNRLLAERHLSVDAEIAFYDHTARSRLVPVLHSQHYDYYLAVGPAVIERIPPARRVLDFGCGVGILTTCYASVFPNIEFVGIDRSSVSIATASAEARRRGLRNVHFEVCDLPGRLPAQPFDLIVSTHAVLQAEQDPGLPSRNWKTFERDADPERQGLLERRTGLGERLDSLCRLLDARGRMIVCEKTQHLGRRILLQRALGARGLALCANPLALRYRSLGEPTDDGPLFEVGRGRRSCQTWSEHPDWPEGQSLYTVSGPRAHRIGQRIGREYAHRTATAKAGRFGMCRLIMGQWETALFFCYVSNERAIEGITIGSPEDAPLLARLFTQWETRAESDREQLISALWLPQEPLAPGQPVPWYENHTPAAQSVWEALPGKRVWQEATFDEEDGREMHIEVGAFHDWAYLYWANTFDQRQVVIVPLDEAEVLHRYFAESVAEAQKTAQARR